jgi:hypothetical protein
MPNFTELAIGRFENLLAPEHPLVDQIYIVFVGQVSNLPFRAVRRLEKCATHLAKSNPPSRLAKGKAKRRVSD